MSQAQATDFSLSFEVFPAPSPTRQAALSHCVQQLNAYEPDYVSVTQGALGADTQHSFRSVCQLQKLQADSQTPIASHITAGFADQSGIQAYARSLQKQGIKRLVALRGDRRKTPGEGFADACSLVQGLLEVGTFDISVAAYPEVHPKADSPEADLQALKAKLDAGAQRAITQFFFDVDQFLRFRDRARAIGITQPLIAGILPITDFERTQRLAAQCGAHIPAAYHTHFEGTEAAYYGVQEILGTELITELCQRLLQEGVDGLHFYTLNQAKPSMAVLQRLGLRTTSAAAPRELALAS